VIGSIVWESLARGEGIGKKEWFRYIMKNAIFAKRLTETKKQAMYTLSGRQ